MKVLLVNMYYFPNMMGGAEHSVKLLAEGLASEGNTVAVATLDGDNKGNFRKEIINDVIVYREYCGSIYRRRIKGEKNNRIDKIANGLLSIYNPKANNFLKKVIGDFKPDIVHTNNLVSMSYWIWKYCKKMNIGLVHTLRDYWLIDPTTCIGGSHKLISNAFQIIMRNKANHFSGIVVAPSKSTLELFDSFEYFKGVKKRCVVNCIEYDEERLKNSLARKKLIPENNIVTFLYAGSLNENKGVRRLLSEFTLCKGEDIKLVICGNGSLKSEVEKAMASDGRIQYKGKLDSRRMNEEYDQADVLIVPSIWAEPFGRIVIEAAQYGTIVIGSNRGGIPETIYSIKFGRCFDPEKTGELKEMIEFYSNRSNIKKALARGPQNLDKYSLRKQVENYSGIYQETLAMQRNESKS